MAQAKFPPSEVKGAKRCTRCARLKPLGSFHPAKRMRDGRASWCKTCSRIANAETQNTPEAKERTRAYTATPARRAGNLATYHRRRETAIEQQRRYRKTPMGKLVAGRNSARYQLGIAKTEERAEHVRALIADYDREIARVKARREEEDRAA